MVILFTFLFLLFAFIPMYIAGWVEERTYFLYPKIYVYVLMALSGVSLISMLKCITITSFLIVILKFISIQAMAFMPYIFVKKKNK